MPGLAEIPLIDARAGGTLHHARAGETRARALRDTCVSWFPGLVRLLLPQIDNGARRWLERSGSPYFAEVRAIAEALGFPGIWFLNGSYQWSCTSLACEQGGMPWLARTLDWPFPGLGQYADVVHMRGPAGDYYNVSWAGYVGVLTACAAGRFAACINQAPMRRRTEAKFLRIFDVLANTVGTIGAAPRIPPDQLLRQVFDSCSGYAQARWMLETTPIARPAIYTLAGCRPGERCVIERTETQARTREHDTGAANDWIEPHPHWEARIGFSRFFKSTFAQAAEASHTRRAMLGGWSGDLQQDSFSWVVPPVHNPYTRLAVEMCPARGLVRVVGYEPGASGEPAKPVTLPREIAAECAAV